VGPFDARHEPPTYARAQHYDRKRIFNLGYFTWVEQQGVPLDEFNVRADQSFWDGLLELVPAWDTIDRDVNAQSGAAVALNA
jgi:hypothetical protein